MKKAIFTIFAVFFIFSNCIAIEVPKLKSYVNDYANMLNNEEINKLTKILETEETKNSNQIYILTIDSIEGQILENFSIKVAENWKPGQKNKDNGVIIIIIKNERLVRIEVGKGLEGSLTDLLTGRIIDYELTPELKSGNICLGLEKTINSITLAIKGEYKFEKTDKKSKQIKKENENLETVFLIFFVICGFISIINIILGGIVGAILAPTLAYFMLDYSGSILIGIAVLGFILGLISKIILEIILNSRGGGGKSGSSISFGGGGGRFGGGGAFGKWWFIKKKSKRSGL